ncbi:MAG: trigger factor, partial [Buchnera aphidicola]|nr:trigger factor [Buchnera aphidicola]
IQKNLSQEIIHINNNTNINGFRKGKIPFKIIQEKYGEKIYYDVFNKLMQKYFYNFLKEKKIKIIGTPKYYVDDDFKNNQENFKYSVIY